MTTIDIRQARALAALVAALRPDWGERGILKALSDARELGPPWHIAHAALNAAEVPTNRTPAVIALPGDHWLNAREMGSAPIRAKKCDEPGHTGDEAICPECRASTADPDTIARIRAEVGTR